MKPYFLSFTFLLYGALSVLAAGGERPNVILIMADDMGWSDIGCYGGEVRTPYLDRLAADGMRFTQFYNNAKCTTTRASILTGLYPRRGKGGLLRQNMITLGEAMKLAGYQTALSGKWHLGSGDTTHPYRRGFDEYYGLLDGCCNFFNPKQRDPKYKGGRIRKFGYNDKDLTEFPDGYYTTDAFTDHAIECIEKFSKKENPFFLHICYTAPHYPLHAKPEDIKKYVGKFRMGWDKMRQQRHQRLVKMGLIDPKWHLSGRDSRAYDWKSANQDHEDLRMAVYAAMIDSMDQNIGRLMAALRHNDEADNTLVLFLSDNGGCAEEIGEAWSRNIAGSISRRQTRDGRPVQHGNAPGVMPGPEDTYQSYGVPWANVSNTPFREYKHWVHEGGIATPLIAHWPAGIPEERRNKFEHQPGHLIDLMATCVDLGEATYPTEFKGNKITPRQGVSLLPAFLGKPLGRKQPIFWEHEGNRALRDGKWKLVAKGARGPWELYDIEADRTELNDLSKKHADRAESMAERWEAWAISAKAKPWPWGQSRKKPARGKK